MLDTTPYLWVVSHLQVIGWPAVIYAAYRIIKACFRLGRAATLVEQRVLDGERTLHLLATNHLPHLEMAIKETTATVAGVHTTMQGIRDDLKLLMVKE